MTDPLDELTQTFMTDITVCMYQIAEATSGETTYNGILKALQNGDVGCKLIFDGEDDTTFMGMILYDVVDYADGKCLVVSAAAGRLESRYEEIQDLLNTLARNYECVAWEIKGRRGWVRAFKKFGAVEKMVTIRKEI